MKCIASFVVPVYICFRCSQHWLRKTHRIVFGNIPTPNITKTSTTILLGSQRTGMSTLIIARKFYDKRSCVMLMSQSSRTTGSETTVFRTQTSTVNISVETLTWLWNGPSLHRLLRQRRVPCTGQRMAPSTLNMTNSHSILELFRENCSSSGFYRLLASRT